VSAAGKVGSLPADAFGKPAGIAADDRGNLYIADKGAHVIRKLDGASGVLSILAGTPDHPGFSNGDGALAQFNAPAGIAWQSAGGGDDIADTGNHVVRKMELGGNYHVSTVAGKATVPGCADGSGDGALFNRPEGIIVDGDGTLFLADTGNSTIREIAPSGMVSTLAGNPGTDGVTGVAGFKDGSGLNARFNQPSDIVLSPDGEFLYVADTGNRAVRKIDAGNQVSTLPLVESPSGPVTAPSGDGNANGGGGAGIGSGWFFAALIFSVTLRPALRGGFRGDHDKL
jgi:DNA-binding beta-propeller fold protein YncE